VGRYPGWFFLSTEFVDKKNRNARLMAFWAMRIGLRDF